MRNTIAVLLLTLGTSSALAQTEVSSLDVCSGLGSLAETVMSGRQQGVPMSTMMSIAEGGDLGAAKGVVQKLIIAAYDQPAFSTTSFQEKASTQFRNAVEVECFKTASKM